MSFFLSFFSLSFLLLLVSIGIEGAWMGPLGDFSRSNSFDVNLISFFPYPLSLFLFLASPSIQYPIYPSHPLRPQYMQYTHVIPRHSLQFKSLSSPILHHFMAFILFNLLTDLPIHITNTPLPHLSDSPTTAHSTKQPSQNPSPSSFTHLTEVPSPPPHHPKPFSSLA